jgi:hypothetical protein
MKNNFFRFLGMIFGLILLSIDNITIQIIGLIFTVTDIFMIYYDIDNNNLTLFNTITVIILCIYILNQKIIKKNKWIPLIIYIVVIRELYVIMNILHQFL